MLLINQGFQVRLLILKALDMIKELNTYKERESLVLSVDGGVNSSNIGLLPVDKVVSGSYVLKADNPIKNIMKLQTSSQYEEY